MNTEQGKVKVTVTEQIDENVYFFDRYTVNVIQKIDGNYIEILMNEEMIEQGYVSSGNETVENGSVSDEWLIMPNKTLDECFASRYGTHTKTWLQELTTI